MNTPFHAPQIALAVVDDLLNGRPVRDAVGNAHSGDIFVIHDGHRDKLSPHTRVDFLVAFPVCLHAACDALLEVVGRADDDAALIFEFVVQADEEVQNLIAQLVGLVHDDNRRSLTFEVVDGFGNHFGNRAARSFDAHHLQQLGEELFAVPILRAGQHKHVAVLAGVCLYRLRLAAPGITRHGQHQRVLLRILEQVIHTGIALGLYDNPFARVVTDLRRDITPHLLGD